MTYHEVAEGTAGTPYGHVPGHQFHDVIVTISHDRDANKFRAHVLEKWGSDQGYEEIHGSNEVSANDREWQTALLTVEERAREAGIEIPKLVQAIDAASREMED